MKQFVAASFVWARRSIGFPLSDPRFVLPERYEPLLLTFHDPKIVDGATVIGNDYGTLFHLVNSEIISIDPNSILPQRFVNSSTDRLAACIAAHTDYVRAITAANSEAKELAAVESFAAAIGQIDPHCLAQSENWWSVIIEQMRGGQL